MLFIKVTFAHYLFLYSFTQNGSFNCDGLLMLIGLVGLVSNMIGAESMQIYLKT